MSKDSESRETRPSAEAARQERLAQALRDNLKRRKAQSRGRGDTRPPQDRNDT